MSPRHRNWLFPDFLILLTLAGFLLSVKLGAVRMTWQEIWAGLFPAVSLKISDSPPAAAGYSGLSGWRRSGSFRSHSSGIFP